MDRYMAERSRFTPRGYAPPPRSSSPSTISTTSEERPRWYQHSMTSDDSTEQSSPTSSNPSSNSSRQSSFDTSSVASSISEIPEMSVPPWHIRKPDEPLDATQIQYGYSLPCIERATGCRVVFHPEQWQLWIAHSLSHYGGIAPPTRTLCPFCDGVNGTFDHGDDRTYNWWRKMFHLGEHFASGHQYKHMRMDHFVLEQLYDLRRIEESVFKEEMVYTERPTCPDLCLVFPDREAPRGRNNDVGESHEAGEIYDMRRERREQQRSSRTQRRAQESSHRSRNL